MSSAETRGIVSRRRALWLSAGVLGVLLIAAAIWTGFNAIRVGGELSTAKAVAARLQSDLAAGDLKAAERDAARLEVHARAAVASSGDPVWHAAEYLPMVGPNLSAARVIASELDDLSTGVITPSLDLASNLTSIWSSHG